MPMDRRLFLAALSACGFAPPALAAGGVRLGLAKPFSFAGLVGFAKKSATQPYKATVSAAAAIKAIDFDAVQKIRFRADHALWPGAAHPVSFFPLSRYSADPVTIHAVADGQARAVLYGPDYFDFAHIDPHTMEGMGFSGFRLMDGAAAPTDWLAFQGASYFRSSGQDAQYGASARGIAINTAGAGAEEFPRFSQFWLQDTGATTTIFALLEGPSVTGAYRFEARKDETVTIDVHCELFFRSTVARLGIAPLTSMYWYGENMRAKAADWRPEIHDSDGLALFTGKGERIWRPLINPPQVQTNSFQDESPRGFGLMQRDRDFANYQDDGAWYNRRPGIWVEPKGDWGAGAVELVEIPTDGEVDDNIVAFWRPAGDAQAGAQKSFDYRLYWQDSEPAWPKSIARVVATRLGRGGIPGQAPVPRDRHKFAIDFTGGDLDGLKQRFDLTPVVTASRGRIENAHVLKVVGTERWRALFDLSVEGGGPVDLRLFLKLGDRTLSETWLYKYIP
jgi:glucans biosynthesis protein